MAIVSSQVTVTTTSQSIVSVDNVSRDVLLHAKQAMLIGNSGITSSNGFLMDNDDKVRLTLMEGEDLWAITANGTSSLYVLVSKVD
jgi:chemotaxis protein CheY-P-specific phosphatase CheC